MEQTKMRWQRPAIYSLAEAHALGDCQNGQSASPTSCHNGVSTGEYTSHTCLNGNQAHGGCTNGGRAQPLPACTPGSGGYV